MYRTKVGVNSQRINNTKYISKRTYIPREVARALKINKGDLLLWEKKDEGFIVSKDDEMDKED